MWYLSTNAWESWLAAITCSRLAGSLVHLRRRSLCSPRRVKIFQFTGQRSSSAMNLRSESSSGSESAVPYSLMNSRSSLRLIFSSSTEAPDAHSSGGSSSTSRQ